jgi:hypothetical protein
MICDLIHIRYEGEWKNDNQEGNGTFYYKDGDLYTPNAIYILLAIKENTVITIPLVSINSLTQNRNMLG